MMPVQLADRIRLNKFFEHEPFAGCFLHPESRGDCMEQKEAMTKCIAAKLPICGLLSLAFLFLIIVAPIPLCMMCCCGERPVQVHCLTTIMLSALDTIPLQPSCIQRQPGLHSHAVSEACAHVLAEHLY